MNAKHTPEPWYVESDGDGKAALHRDVYIVAENGEGRVCTMTSSPIDGESVKRPTAARIVACVNACAGISDPAAFVGGVERLIAELQNDSGVHHLDSSTQEAIRALAILGGK